MCNKLIQMCAENYFLKINSVIYNFSLFSPEGFLTLVITYVSNSNVFYHPLQLDLLENLTCSLSFSRLMFYCIKVLIVMMVVEIQARWLISAVKHLFIMCTDEMKT